MSVSLHRLPRLLIFAGGMPVRLHRGMPGSSAVASCRGGSRCTLILSEMSKDEWSELSHRSAYIYLVASDFTCGEFTFARNTACY
jgi:hypothetical protein